MMQEVPLDQFRYGDRLQLAWTLAWPCAFVDLTYELTKDHLGLPGHIKGGVIDLVVRLLLFFFFSTWVVRRTVRLSFPRFHLVVVRGNSGERTRAMKYRESLSVAWLLNWRATAMTLGIIVPILVAVVIVRGALPADRPSDLLGLLGRFGSFGVGLLMEVLIFSLMLKAAIRKDYAGFSLGLEREPPLIADAGSV
jgi:hypothetical protein